MIIIFEGCDGTGKTTLVERTASMIRDRTGVMPRLLHRGPPTRDPLIEYTLDLEDDPLDAWTLCDRWHWGELIYGPIYRGASLLGDAGHHAVDEFLARRNALLVHVDHRLDVVMERLTHRGDDYVKLEHVPAILQAYRDLRDTPTPLKCRTIFGVGTNAQIADLLKDAVWYKQKGEW